MAKFLFLECREGEADELWFASCWAKEFAKTIRGLGHEVIEIESPSPSDANAIIAAEKPDVCWFIGHGYCCLTSLEHMELWISTPLDTCYVRGEAESGCTESKNEDIFADMIVNALSCLTGQYLAGHLTMHHNCTAYLGYKDVFFLNYAENCACGCKIEGVRDEVARAALVSMHDANLYFCLGIAMGMSVEDAYNYSLERFDEWIEWFNARYMESISDTEAAIIRLTLLILSWDKEQQVIYGKLDQEIVPMRPTAMQPIAGLMSIPLIIGCSYRLSELR